MRGTGGGSCREQGPAQVGIARGLQQSQRWVIMRKFLVTSHENTKMKQKNDWLEHIAQSRHLTFRQDVESQQKFSHFLMGQHPGSNTRS